MLHATYPKQILQEGEYKAVPHHVTKVVAVMHNRDHYALMVIDIPEKKVCNIRRTFQGPTHMDGSCRKWDEAMHASGFE